MEYQAPEILAPDDKIRVQIRVQNGFGNCTWHFE